MKQIIAGVVLVLVLGVAGFLYRNVMERPTVPGADVACTMEAKICPDGQSVGRTGPSCAFAVCPLPNAEDTAMGIAFVVPSGYVANPDPIGPDETLRAVFEKPNPQTQDVPHAIVIRRYPILEGQTAAEVMVENTILEPADMGIESVEKFTLETIAGRTFYVAVVERFEAQIHSVYYLPRTTDVLRFEVLERDVEEWMEPSLNVEQLQEHRALLQLLESLQLTQGPVGAP